MRLPDVLASLVQEGLDCIPFVIAKKQIKIFAQAFLELLSRLKTDQQNTLFRETLHLEREEEYCKTLHLEREEEYCHFLPDQTAFVPIPGSACVVRRGFGACSPCLSPLSAASTPHLGPARRKICVDLRLGDLGGSIVARRTLGENTQFALPPK